MLILSFSFYILALVIFLLATHAFKISTLQRSPRGCTLLYLADVDVEPVLEIPTFLPSEMGIKMQSYLSN